MNLSNFFSFFSLFSDSIIYQDLLLTLNIGPFGPLCIMIIFFTSVKHSHFSIVLWELCFSRRRFRCRMCLAMESDRWVDQCGTIAAATRQKIWKLWWQHTYTHTQQVVNCYARGTQIGFGPVFLLIMTSNYIPKYTTYGWMEWTCLKGGSKNFMHISLYYYFYYYFVECCADWMKYTRVITDN